VSHFVEKIALKSPSPGTERFLTVHRFKGAVEGPKVYLQAALHADEWPGMIALQHLLQKLIELDKEDRLAGEIIVVPFANPIGLDQKLNGVVLGRQSFSAEGNFNRNWPDLSKAAEQSYQQGSNSAAQIKQSLRDAIKQLPTVTPLQHLKSTLLSLSIDADIVLDLHCDSQALLHLYSNYRHKEQAEILAQHLKIPVLLLEDEPGGSPFDAAHVLPWIAVETKLSHSCFAATVEFRGEADVNDELAAQDAAGLLSFLATQGSIQGSQKECEPFAVTSTDLDAVDAISATKSGIICWKIALGDRVIKGQLIAQIVDLTAHDPATGRTDIFARTAGVLFAQGSARLVTEGDNVGKIAGSEVLENLSGGGLLTL
jgi:predicted deacylase